MKFEEFQHLARLYVLGTLEEDELAQFKAGRELFGPKGEAFIDKCRKLGATLALGLDPIAPHPDTKRKLMAKIKKLQEESGQKPLPPNEVGATDAFVLERRRSHRPRC